MNGTSWKRARHTLASARAPLLFGLHTTAAALAALALAGAAGIHHPWWAAMTVWLVAQPTRGLFVERCAARLAGTAVGALAGGMLLYLLFDSPQALLILLAIWLVLCAAIGNLFRHFRNYAWVLAGYTAAIVALFGLADPVLDPELATGRVACTVIGILCSSVTSWLFTPSSAPAALLEEQIERLVTGSIHWSMACPSRLSPGHHPDLSQLLGMIKALDGSFDLAVAGSRSGKRRVRHAHQVADSLLLVLAVVHKLTQNREQAPWLSHFDNRLSDLENLDTLIECIKQKTPQGVEYQQLLSVLAALRDVLLGTENPVSGWTRVVHHDWRAASTAAVRPLSALSVTALIWQLTGWSDGPIMAMTSVLFASLFSSHSDTRTAVKDVFIGSLMGAAAGLTARIWLLPQAQGYVQLLLLIAPFLLTGAFLMARAKSAKMAIDLNMTFLLTAQPGVLFHGGRESLLLQTLAIVLGVMAAAGSLLLWQPYHPQNRRLALARRIARQTLQAVRPSGLASAHARARPLLRSLVLIDGNASDLVKAALTCVAVTTPPYPRSVSATPQLPEQAGHEARLAAQALAALATH